MAVGAGVQVRAARPGDFPALAKVLARAFHEDPLTTWLYPRDRSRPRHARRSFVVSLHRLAPQGQIWTTTDLAGAALWALPGQWREDLRQTLRMVPLLPPLLPRLPRTVRAMAAIEAAHPHEPHYYLSILGTDPPRRRSGVASALVRHVLDRCDEERMPAFLETATRSNVAFYAGLGFTELRRLDLPGGAPPLWLLWRDPR
jgi:ribosomal protein S18 acetylase RimI-like enzyme